MEGVLNTTSWVYRGCRRLRLNSLSSISMRRTTKRSSKQPTPINIIISSSKHSNSSSSSRRHFELSLIALIVTLTASCLTRNSPLCTTLHRSRRRKRSSSSFSSSLAACSRRAVQCRQQRRAHRLVPRQRLRMTRADGSVCRYPLCRLTPLRSRTHMSYRLPYIPTPRRYLAIIGKGHHHSRAPSPPPPHLLLPLPPLHPTLPLSCAQRRLHQDQPIGVYRPTHSRLTAPAWRRRRGGDRAGDEVDPSAREPP